MRPYALSAPLFLLPLAFSFHPAIEARYGPILTVNLIRKLGELTFLAGIFIHNNINSTYPLKNIAMQKFELKWRKNTHLNPRNKTPTNQRQSHGLKGPLDSQNREENLACTPTYMWDPPVGNPAKVCRFWRRFWFGRTRVKATNLHLPRAASSLAPNGGSKWLQLFSRP
jgi:hypothetical protein